VRRPLLILAVSLLLAIAGGAVAGEDLIAMTNADRAAKGLRAVSTARDLQSFAQRHAEDMARAGKLRHSEDLGSKISNWRRLGENVGRGPNVTNIHRNFMASPHHRDNILLPQFSEVGVGVAEGRQHVYVAVVFREPAVAASPAPAPAPPPTSRPRRTVTAPKPRANLKPKPAAAPTTTTPPTTAPPVPVAVPEPPPAPEVPPEPPPAPPVEAAPEPAFQPRPVYKDPDFLAANFLDALLPKPEPQPARDAETAFRPTAMDVIGVVGFFAGVHHVRLRWRQIRARRPRLRWRGRQGGG
jgi:cysteine-rich secretory family protein